MLKIKEFIKNSWANILKFVKNNWTDILKPVVVLLCICIVIPLALSVTNAVTKERIADLEKQKAIETMESLIVADEFEQLRLGGETVIKYNRAIKDGAPVGYIFETSANGYGGAVSVMTAINIDGTVKSIAILDVSNETPGLGQNAQKEGFYSQYSGKKSGIKLVKNSAVSENNEVNAMTGATITSTAVTNAVNEALEQFDTISKNAEAISEGGVAVIEE